MEGFLGLLKSHEKDRPAISIGCSCNASESLPKASEVFQSIMKIAHTVGRTERANHLENNMGSLRKKIQCSQQLLCISHHWMRKLAKVICVQQGLQSVGSRGLSYGPVVTGHGAGLEATLSGSSTGTEIEAQGQWQSAETAGSSRPLLQSQHKHHQKVLL